MKISVDENRSILLEEVFSGVGFKTEDGEEFGICMRDSGFEFNYGGKWYEAKNGIVKKMEVGNNCESVENNTPLPEPPKEVRG